MKITVIFLTMLIGLLSAAAGIAKVLLVPDEVQFLEGFGFTETMIIAYGGFQLVGGVLFVVPVTFVIGTVIVLLAFLLSTVLLFLAGDFAFAIFSILPIVLAAFVAFYKVRVEPKNREADE